MAGNDLIIVFAPWVIFAAALVIILLQLRWPRRPWRRPPHTDAPPSQRHQPRPEESNGKPAASPRKAAEPGQQDQFQSGDDTSGIFKHEREVA